MNLSQSIEKRLTDSCRRAEAEEALLDFCQSQPEIRSLMGEFQISRHDLQQLYDLLIKEGAGQWKSGHWVPASALAYPESLRYIIMRRNENKFETNGKLRVIDFETGANPKDNNLETVVSLLEYFESGSALKE